MIIYLAAWTSLLTIIALIVPIWAYRRGLKDGLILIKHEKTIPDLKPLKAIKEVLPSKQTEGVKGEMDKLMQGIDNILMYDGSKGGI